MTMCIQYWLIQPLSFYGLLRFECRVLACSKFAEKEFSKYIRFIYTFAYTVGEYCWKDGAVRVGFGATWLFKWTRIIDGQDSALICERAIQRSTWARWDLNMDGFRFMS
jgi:hypothetical protein